MSMWDEHPPSTGDEQEITYYFKKTYRYTTIVLFLMLHYHIELPPGTLKCWLQIYSLERKICNTTEDNLKQIILEEIEGWTAAKGYRALFSSLKVSFRVNIKSVTLWWNCSENHTQMEAKTKKHMVWEEDNMY